MPLRRPAADTPPAPVPPPGTDRPVSRRRARTSVAGTIADHAVVLAVQQHHPARPRIAQERRDPLGRDLQAAQPVVATGVGVRSRKYAASWSVIWSATPLANWRADRLVLQVGAKYCVSMIFIASTALAVPVVSRVLPGICAVRVQLAVPIRTDACRVGVGQDRDAFAGDPVSAPRGHSDTPACRCRQFEPLLQRLAQQLAGSIGDQVRRGRPPAPAAPRRPCRTLSAYRPAGSRSPTA